MSSTVCNLLISERMYLCNLLGLSPMSCCTSPRATVAYNNKTRLSQPVSRTRCLVSRTRCLVSRVGRTRRGGQTAYKHASASRNVSRNNMDNTWQGGLAPHTSLITHEPDPYGAPRCHAPRLRGPPGGRGEILPSQSLARAEVFPRGHLHSGDTVLPLVVHECGGDARVQLLVHEGELLRAHARVRREHVLS